MARLILNHNFSIGTLISLVSATTACTDASEPDPTEDVGTCDEDVARAAELVLQQNCHECHGQNGTANGSMNFIMDAEKLVERGLVIPGDPDGSRIYARMTQDTMPPVGVMLRPDDAARESVRKWIECGAPPFEETESAREFVSPTEVLSILRQDLEQREDADRKFIRYLSLVNLYNDPNVSDDSLSTYRHGLNKQVNDVSFGSDIVLPVSIDDRGILYRIDIRHYDWQAEANAEDLWELMAREYPYGIHYPKQEDAAFLYEHTTSLTPVMNADFFVFAASEPPLYYAMLRLPPTVAQLREALGVGQNGEVWTAGVVNSGVSAHNRIVRRSTSTHGMFWESADFSGSKDERDILNRPLSPKGEFPDYEHMPDGGEFIFRLPNELHGYLITNAIGDVIDEAPTDIVFDKNDQFNGAVRSGRKCAKCHPAGINPAVDDVRPYVESSDFPMEVRAKVQAEYPTVAEFDEIVASDRADFLAARAVLGIPANVEGNDSVPISFLADAFQASVDIDRAAADFGLPVEELRAKIESSPDPDLRKSLGPLLLDGKDIKREAFRDAFPDAVCAFGLGQRMINGEIVTCAGSCRELLESDATAPDGVYLFAPVGYVGDPFPAWCDMTTDGGGWTLAMRFAPGGQFHFFSPHWTSESLVNEGVLEPTDPSDGKFRAYDSVPGTEIRGCLQNPISLGYGCKTYAMPTPSTLLGLFTTVPVGSDLTQRGHYFDEADAQKQEWLTIQGLTLANSSVLAPNYLAVGINIDDDQTCFDARVRFGLVINDEFNIVALNDAAGFGAQSFVSEACDLEGVDSVWATASGFASGPNIYSTAGQIWIR